jgi:DNA/RNA-binding domain of Phe-tRNA-synthetase-like protein
VRPEAEADVSINEAESASPELAQVVRAGVLWLEGADGARARSPASVRRWRPLKPRSALHPPADAQAVRTMYKRVGLDPTKRRPLMPRRCCGACARAIRCRGSTPWSDVCNWCSLEFQLPYGLYDAALIEGDEVEMRIGRDGESYAGIRKDEVHVGGRIALADAKGPFGNPSSDSARTMVTTATTRAMLVVFAPRETSEKRLASVLERHGGADGRIHRRPRGCPARRVVVRLL